MENFCNEILLGGGGSWRGQILPSSSWKKRLNTWPRLSQLDAPTWGLNSWPPETTGEFRKYSQHQHPQKADPVGPLGSSNSHSSRVFWLLMPVMAVWSLLVPTCFLSLILQTSLWSTSYSLSAYINGSFLLLQPMPDTSTNTSTHSLLCRSFHLSANFSLCFLTVSPSLFPHPDFGSLLGKKKSHSSDWNQLRSSGSITSGTILPGILSSSSHSPKELLQFLDILLKPHFHHLLPSSFPRTCSKQHNNK